MDCSLPGSSVHAILQARILEWVANSLLQGIFLTQGSQHRTLRPFSLLPPGPCPSELLLAHLLWPAFSRGHGEEGQQCPQHVVIMELILLPLSIPRLHLILLIEEVLASATENGDR